MKEMSFTAEKIMYENTAKIKMCANQFPKTEKFYMTCLCSQKVPWEFPFRFTNGKLQFFQFWETGLHTF